MARSRIVENQPNLYQREYFTDAFRAEMQTVWYGTPYMAVNELENLCHFRALACCYKRSTINVKRSRRLLFQYLSEFQKKHDTDLINVLYKQLPVASFAHKYLSNICTNYKYLPRRRFGENGSQDEEFKPHYERHINKAFREAHQLARLMNIVAVRPIVWNGELAVRLLTPDHFRVETSAEDGMTPVAIWYPVTNDEGICQIKRWTADVIETLEGGKVVGTDDNPYGELPYTFLRLTEGEDFYGGGDHDILEQRMEANAMRFHANLSSKYDTRSIMLLINTGIDATKQALGPGAVITKDNVSADPTGEVEPRGEFFSPNGQYEQIDTLRRERRNELLRDRGIPNSSLTDQPGVSLSGASRIAERIELNDAREEDSDALAIMEAEFKRLAAVVLNKDLGLKLTVDNVISVSFQHEPVILEPKDEFTLEMTLVENFINPLTDLVNKFSNVENEMSDDDVRVYMNKNKALYEEILGKQPLMALPGPAKVAETLGDPSAGTEGLLKPAENIDTTAVEQGKAGVINQPAGSANNQPAPAKK